MKWDAAGLEVLPHGSVLPQVGQKMHPSPFEHHPELGTLPWNWVLSSVSHVLCQTSRKLSLVLSHHSLVSGLWWLRKSLQKTTVRLNALTLLPVKLHEDNVFCAGFAVSVRAPSLHPVKCNSREATGKTFQNNQFVLVLMGSLNIEVLFLQGTCVYAEHQQKSPNPKTGCESLVSQRGSLKVPCCHWCSEQCRL